MKLVQKTTRELSAWAQISEKTFEDAHHPEPQTYHSFIVADYINLIGLTPDQKIPIVKQYRPALECFTWELPGGLREGDESPAERAKTELWEETGMRTSGDLQQLGPWYPDSGRLENRLWGYVAKLDSSQPPANWKPEIGVDSQLVDLETLWKMIDDGEFIHALHIALIMTAFRKGWLK